MQEDGGGVDRGVQALDEAPSVEVNREVSNGNTVEMHHLTFQADVVGIDVLDVEDAVTDMLVDRAIDQLVVKASISKDFVVGLAVHEPERYPTLGLIA